MARHEHFPVTGFEIIVPDHCPWESVWQSYNWDDDNGFHDKEAVFDPGIRGNHTIWAVAKRKAERISDEMRSMPWRDWRDVARYLGYDPEDTALQWAFA